MKKFEMSMDKTKKELNVRIWGMFGPDDANAFIEEFNKIVTAIQPKEFVLAFDAKELNVSKPEMLPMLEGCFKMYKAIGFKKVLAKVGSNVTLKMQLGRVGRNAGLDIEVI